MTSSNHIAWVYIITNEPITVLYCGYSTALHTRVWEHQTKQNPNSFTARYNVCKLVFYKGFNSIESAQAFEKKVKGKSREWKIRLINSMNPEWRDLSDEAKDL